MTSLPTQSTYQFSLDTEMEQKRFSSDRTATNGSRMPPDGHEFPTNKMSSSFDDKEKETKRFELVYFSPNWESNIMFLPSQ